MQTNSTVQHRQHPEQARTSQCGTVRLYEGRGVSIESPNRGPIAKRGGVRETKRGKVASWSSASRRRLRRVLLESLPPVGWHTIGLSFTVPGPALPHRASRDLWLDFCNRVNLEGLAMIWRCEIQKRGALHWHAVGIGENPVGAHRVVESFRELWRDAVGRLGPHEFNPPYRGANGSWSRGVVSVSSLMALPGAGAHAFDGQADSAAGCRSAWLRYLQDHASKGKQEQIPESIGRHWGIVGRKNFEQASPTGIEKLTRKPYARFIRALQRLATPSYPCEGVPFGRRLGFRIRRGSGYGTSVWFTNTATIKRLVEWAKSGSDDEEVSR